MRTSIITGCLFTIVMAGLCMAQAETADPNAAASQHVTYPYIGEITANNVMVRSGPGRHYYHCARVNKGDRLKVVASQFTWSRIVPPTGTFSWVSKQYVDINTDNPDYGTINSQARIWAGSPELRPLHSTSLQMKLEKDDTVRLLGEELDGYYKIVPPEGAYLWVSSQFIQPAENTAPPAPAQEPAAPAAPQQAPQQPQVEPVDINETLAVVDSNISVESEQLQKYYAIKDQIEAEKTKPIGKQSYRDIKAELKKIINTKDADKAARFSEVALEQVERYELAVMVFGAVKNQNQQLEQTMDKIESAKKTKKENMTDLGRYTVIGTFEVSNIFNDTGKSYYRLLDETGKTLCYATPADAADDKDYQEMVGRRVGVIGELSPFEQTSSALVKFTDISKLNGLD